MVDSSGPVGRVDLWVEGHAGAELWADDLDLGPGWVGAVVTAAPLPEFRIAELRNAELPAAAATSPPTVR